MKNVRWVETVVPLVRLTSLCAVVSAASLLAGCAEKAEVDRLSGEVAQLQAAVDSRDKKVAELEATLTKLRTDVLTMRFDRYLNTTAFITPGSDGYSTIKTDMGAITVRLENVVSFANGSKATLIFGNPSAAILTGLKAKLEWGRVDKDGIAVDESKKERIVRFEKDLAAGRWTSVAVTLDGVPASELGFIRVSDLVHEGITLRTK